MIAYSSSRPWEFLHCGGSAIPKALVWALPSAALAVLFSRVLKGSGGWPGVLTEPSATERAIFALFTSAVGALIAFRTQKSYARYWEGITLIERACGVWLNGCSNLIAFSSPCPEMREKVDEFQYCMSRLMSLAVCYCMCDISGLERSHFEHLEVDGIDTASVKYLDMTSARQYVALQWMQRLVVENARSGVLNIQAPILSRVFQELSIGIVHFVDAKKISVVPIPYVFAQLLWCLLVFASLFPIPMLCASSMEEGKAAAYTFFVVWVFWAVYEASVAIETPFRAGRNQLPLDKLNYRFNKVLTRLLESKAQQIPEVVMSSTVSALRFARRGSISTTSFHTTQPPHSQGVGGTLRSVLKGNAADIEVGAPPLYLSEQCTGAIGSLFNSEIAAETSGRFSTHFQVEMAAEASSRYADSTTARYSSTDVSPQASMQRRSVGTSPSPKGSAFEWGPPDARQTSKPSHFIPPPLRAPVPMPLPRTPVRPSCGLYSDSSDGSPLPAADCRGPSRETTTDETTASGPSDAGSSPWSGLYWVAPREDHRGG